MNTVHRRIKSRQMGSRLSLKFMHPGYWKGHFSPQALLQRKLQAKLKFEALCQRRDKDSMTSYRRRFDVSGVLMSPLVDEYASLGTPFTNLFGVRDAPSSNNEVSFAAQDA